MDLRNRGEKCAAVVTAGQRRARLWRGGRAAVIVPRGEEELAPSELRTSTPVAARCLRILPTTLGLVRNAMICIGSPEHGHTGGSTTKTRQIRCAQRRPQQVTGTSFYRLKPAPRLAKGIR